MAVRVIGKEIVVSNDRCGLLKTAQCSPQETDT